MSNQFYSNYIFPGIYIYIWYHMPKNFVSLNSYFFFFYLINYLVFGLADVGIGQKHKYLAWP